MHAPAVLNAAELRGLLAHLDEHVVLVCQSGQRATQAECTLLSNVHILDGGMNASS